MTAVNITAEPGGTRGRRQGRPVIAALPLLAVAVGVTVLLHQFPTGRGSE